MTKMNKLADWGRWTALMLVLALVVAGSLGLGVRDSWAKGGNWKNVTVVYSTDVKGKIDPCG